MSRRQLYSVDRWAIEAAPLSDGSISISVRDTDCLWAEQYFRGHSCGATWYKPWTWGHRTVQKALDKAIAYADARARQDREAKWNVEEATRLIDGVKDRADALRELEKEFAA